MRYKWMAAIICLFILSTVSPGQALDGKPTVPLILGAGSIMGDPIRINVDTNGMFDVLYKKTTTYIDSVYASDTCIALRYTTGQGARQYGHHPLAGPILGANGQFTFVSQTVTPWNIYNVWTTPDGLTITQAINYTNGLKYFNIQWQVTTSTTVSNLKLFHGSDVFVEGDDANDQLQWDASHNLVYAIDVTVADSYIMGLYGVTPPTEHQVDFYGHMWNSILSGALNNQDFQSSIDGGVALAWTRSSLSPGQTWTVQAVWIMDPAFVAQQIQKPKTKMPSLLPLARTNVTKADGLAIQVNLLLTQAKEKNLDTATCEKLISEATDLLTSAHVHMTNPIYANNLALQALQKLQQAIDCLKALLG